MKGENDEATEERLAGRDKIFEAPAAKNRANGEKAGEE